MTGAGDFAALGEKPSANPMDVRQKAAKALGRGLAQWAKPAPRAFAAFSMGREKIPLGECEGGKGEWVGVWRVEWWRMGERILKPMR